MDIIKKHKRNNNYIWANGKEYCRVFKLLKQPYVFLLRVF